MRQMFDAKNLILVKDITELNLVTDADPKEINLDYAFDICDCKAIVFKGVLYNRSTDFNRATVQDADSVTFMATPQVNTSNIIQKKINIELGLDTGKGYIDSTGIVFSKA